jgi:hypothetical protein
MHAFRSKLGRPNSEYIIQTVSGNVSVEWRRGNYVHYVGLNRDIGVITNNETGSGQE